MHIHSVIVSYNRPELTKQAITSYLKTVSIPHTLWVVDNGSDYETLKMLSMTSVAVLYLERNRFPGYATNRGWEKAPPETTLLHRGDNDFAYLPGWCEEVVRCFEHNKRLGQLGLRTNEEEMGNQNNVGGNNVIRRQAWDEGLRYDERPWGDRYPRGWTEDSVFTPEVVKRGWKWTRVAKPCIQSLAQEDPSDPYYQRTWALRGITPPS